MEATTLHKDPAALTTFDVIHGDDHVTSVDCHVGEGAPGHRSASYLQTQRKNARKDVPPDFSVTKAYHDYLLHGELAGMGADEQEFGTHDSENDQQQLLKSTRPRVRMRLHRKERKRGTAGVETQARQGAVTPEHSMKPLDPDDA